MIRTVARSLVVLWFGLTSGDWFLDMPVPRGDPDIGQIVDRAAEHMPPYTIERLCYDGGGVAHFAVTVDAEIAAIAADVAPRWPLITSSLAARSCVTRGA
jgi:hypothetical protein